MFMPALGLICQAVTGGGNRQTWPTWDGTYDGTVITANNVPNQIAYVSSLISPDKTLYVSSDANTGIYAYIVTTSGIIQTVNAPTTISTFGSAALSVCTLDSGRALVAFYDGSGFLNAMVLSISGTTVTKNTPLIVENALTASGCISIANFTTDQSILCWGDSNAPGYFSIVLSTTGTTVTKNTRFQFSSKSMGGTANGVSCCVLSATSIFVCYTDRFGSGGTWSRILSIIGTVITAPTSELQIFSGIPTQISCTAMDSSHTMVVFGQELSAGYVMACSISGTVITAGSYVQITFFGGVNYSSSGNGICSINSNTAMLIYTDNLQYNDQAVILTLSGISITLYTAIALTTGNQVAIRAHNTCVALDASRVIAGYTGSVSGFPKSIVLSII